MKLTANGVMFDGYRSALPSSNYSAFRDEDGATLLIDTVALVQMYELCKLDLERRGGWADVMERARIRPSIGETPQLLRKR